MTGHGRYKLCRVRYGRCRVGQGSGMGRGYLGAIYLFILQHPLTSIMCSWFSVLRWTRDFFGSVYSSITNAPKGQSNESLQIVGKIKDGGRKQKDCLVKNHQTKLNCDKMRSFKTLLWLWQLVGKAGVLQWSGESHSKSSWKERKVCRHLTAWLNMFSTFHVRFTEYFGWQVVMSIIISKYFNHDVLCYPEVLRE